MTTEECTAINNERADRWKKRLIDSNATPVITIGIGHPDGNIVVVTLEDGMLSDEHLAAILRKVAGGLTR